ncbi:MAG: hypothetical protein NFCOHLIN_01077 [Gammaproteobacteria bacterium]|nr:hypothetical protein [Gammaproteobacteria bacterium]
MVRLAAVIILLLGLTVSSGCDNEPDVNPASPITSPSDPDPHWVVQQEPPAKLALVYVHGVFGDMVDTWTASNGKTFFGLVDENPNTKGKADAFVFGFPSFLLKGGSFDIREAANRLHERLQYHGILNYPAVVFVAHSMGGLVVMRELLTHRDILGKVPVVVFYATPQEGAKIALIGQMFAPNTALGQMTEADGNDLLKTLSDEWNSMSQNERPHVRCAYETIPMGPGKIVTWSSATRFCEGSPPAIEANHIDIVKPNRPEHDSIVVLANALNDYVLRRELEAKLETPDFTSEGADAVFNLTNVLGKQSARLVNAGGSALRFTLAEVSDPALLLWPDDTPREIPAQQTSRMSVALSRSASPSITEYHFILRTDNAPDRRVIVRVPDISIIKAQQDRIAKSVTAQINAALADPQLSERFKEAATDDKGPPEALIRIAYTEFERESPHLPDSGKWVLTADLLNSLNWPSLAALALQKAEEASPSVTHMPGVQLLAGVVAAQAGETRVFANVPTPVATPEVLAAWDVSQPLAEPATFELGDELANRMHDIPAFKFYSLSLKGDIQQAKGNLTEARKSYSAAATIRPSPSLVWRRTKLDQG